VIDHVINVSNVIGPLVVDGYIPPAPFSLKTCDREPFTRGHFFEAADSSLPCRRPSTGVKVENKRQPCASVICGRNEQPIGSLPLSR
jgi:hypothetical protein